MQFIQVVLSLSPSMKKLSWKEGVITVTPNPTPVVELAQELVGKLVKFKEVHFSSSILRRDRAMSRDSFDEDVPNHLFFHEQPPRFGNGINSAILRALPAALLEDGSQLKVSTLNCLGRGSYVHKADVAEAQKKLTVNMF